MPEKPEFCGPSLSDRDAWQKFGSLYPEIISSANAALHSDPPSLDNETYLHYSRTGKRHGEYDKNRNRRRSLLKTLTLAECIENDGRYISAICGDIDAILSEVTWVDPAHDSGLRNYRGERIDIDLQAATDGAILGTTLALVGDKIPDHLRGRVEAELHRRIFDPYVTFIRGERPAEYWKSSWLNTWTTASTNWNAVCHAGVALTALAALPDRHLRAEIIASAEAGLGYYLKSFPPSGYCVEGLNYWNYGFGHYVILAETLYRETNGRINFYAGAGVREIASFPIRIEMAKSTYPQFGDSPVNARPMWWVNRLCNPRLGLASPSREKVALSNPGQYLYATGLTMFPLPEDDLRDPERGDSQLLVDPLRSWFPDAGILIARQGADAEGTLAVALKGGVGGANHGHADIGQFVVALNGRTPLLDPGAEPYDSKTFSNLRFTIPRIGSFGHSVPVVGGHWQLGDRSATSRVSKLDFTPLEDTYSIDLAGAYGDPELVKLNRTFTYSRIGAGQLVVEDFVKFSTPQVFGTALITMGKVIQEAPDTLIITDGEARIQVKIESMNQPFLVKIQPLETKLQPAPTRIGIDFTNPVSEATLCCRISPLSEKSQLE